mmetsp:Transcript_4456/g.14440  ORF Transcript_4456/g.14440 Transcript_4456/m.14440 type:complete len:214 (-) Transcript_4456:2560-3201(-)
MSTTTSAMPSDMPRGVKDTGIWMVPKAGTEICLVRFMMMLNTTGSSASTDTLTTPGLGKGLRNDTKLLEDWPMVEAMKVWSISVGALPLPLTANVHSPAGPLNVTSPVSTSLSAEGMYSTLTSDLPKGGSAMEEGDTVKLRGLVEVEVSTTSSDSGFWIVMALILRVPTSHTMMGTSSGGGDVASSSTSYQNSPTSGETKCTEPPSEPARRGE